ncbi:MAG: Leucine--tRNA ligase [Chlamydiia bacterium]|nr:Leucine--tRNA ligase [Chlamydiia bacterium]
MQQKYDFQTIEKKWQAYWSENKTYQVEIDHSKEKCYILDMFPYPSGSGLHVGHPLGYTATDILARYKRMKGFNVLHPMGFDAFGLPAEQHAVRTGTHPAKTTQENIATFTSQLQRLGFSYDWDREVVTTDPEYFKWTQWLFGVLYKKGMAYETDALVNYCPNLGTVLANEEVENGKSVEGGHPVEKRSIRQWMLKITAYAEQLLEGLDDLDWPESLKNMQRNWIGKSEGVELTFSLNGSDQTIDCYTTRIDTLFGATFIVLAPEHPLVETILTPEIEAYRTEALNKSEIDRSHTEKEKTGVFTGHYAINPVSGEKMPIWIADYVLINYGTGAVMGVPAHCERDFDFAKKYELPIQQVIESEEECFEGEGEYIHSSREGLSLHGLDLSGAKEAVTAFLEKAECAKRCVKYKLRDWLFSRQRYWGEPVPLLKNAEGEVVRVLEMDELPLMPPPMDDYRPSKDGRSPLAKVKDWVEYDDPVTGQKLYRETNTMPQWAGSCWYYLRYLDPSNSSECWSKEAEKYWMPVDLYVGGLEHAVLHLLYARFWHKVFFDAGLVSTSEPFQQLRNQGVITARSYRRHGGGYVPPDQVSNGKILSTGEEVVSQVEKMSKSKLNGVRPEEVIDEYGADTLRVYIMFMGPFDMEKVWCSESIIGSYRFLKRFYEMATSEKVSDEVSDEALRLGHKLIKGAEQDIIDMQFNTAISKMMEFINDFTKLDVYPKSVLRMVVKLLYLFAPHMGEELWQHLGGESTISYEEFPIVDESYLVDKTTTMVFQVNGKVRGKAEVPINLQKEAAIELAKATPTVQKYLNGQVLKEIHVPNKLVNIVVRP